MEKQPRGDGRALPAVPTSAPADPDPPAAADTRGRPRLGATARLLAVAAVIGISAGTAVGYGIQADRKPDPLPPLSRPGLAYPAKPLPDGERLPVLSAAEDRGVKVNGDLRRLLLPRPAGARDALSAPSDDGWLDIPAYLREHDNSQYMLYQLMERGIRRIAGASWEQGDRTYEIRLIQFRASEGAGVFAETRHEYLGGDGVLDGGDPLPGSGNGRYYLLDPDPGYEERYQGRAVVRRGDITADITIRDTGPVTAQDIRVLAERQLERL
ncbi:hypothetical protein ACWDR0_11370 [Streptomyces sp. NPDC003691]